MRRTVSLTIACVLMTVGVVVSQGGRPLLPGSPLPGITPTEFELFRLGLEDFTEVETAGEGLGPTFNGTSCASCHSVPAIGGTSTISEVRGGYRDEEGKFVALYDGTLYHLFSVPNHRCQVQIPPEANVIAKRVPIPLFGAGLVEAIPDEAILALEDPEDADNDGISGRAARVIDVASKQLRVGRFGWKSQHATLLAFGADAYRNEMGITNDLFRDEFALGVSPEKMKYCDPRPDPEDVRDRTTGMRGIDNFESFMKFLAPLERGPIDDTVRLGEQIFATMGCTSCHVPQLISGPSPNPPFNRRPVPLYSDLLLHDIGTGDGIEQDGAGADEIRTPALWGLRFRRPLLHDGSAATIEQAVQRHLGEASEAQKRYADLPLASKKELLAFLNSL